MGKLWARRGGEGRLQILSGAPPASGTVRSCAIGKLISDTGCGRRRTVLSDASVGGVDDEQVGLGPVGDVGRDRSQQPPGEAAAESDIADDQQVRVDLLGQIH